MNIRKISKGLVVVIAMVVAVAFTITMPLQAEASTTKTRAQTKAPGKVTGLKVKQNKSASLTFSWKKVKKADGYLIYCYDSKYKCWTSYWKTNKCKFTASTKEMDKNNFNYYNKNLYVKVKAYIECVPKVQKTFKSKEKESKFYSKYGEKYGKFSKKVKIKLKKAPLPEMQVNYLAQGDKYQLTWKNLTNLKSYEIYRKIGSQNWTRQVIYDFDEGWIRTPVYYDIDKEVQAFNGPISFKMVFTFKGGEKSTKTVMVNHTGTITN